MVASEYIKKTHNCWEESGTLTQKLMCNDTKNYSHMSRVCYFLLDVYVIIIIMYKEFNIMKCG